MRYFACVFLVLSLVACNTETPTMPAGKAVATQDAPSKPRNLTGIADAVSVTLSWEAPEVGTVDKYEVRRRHLEVLPREWVSWEVNDMTYTDIDVTSATQYIYRVVAINGTDRSKLSTPFKIATLDPNKSPLSFGSVDVHSWGVDVCGTMPKPQVPLAYEVKEGEVSVVRYAKKDSYDHTNSGLLCSSFHNDEDYYDFGCLFPFWDNFYRVGHQWHWMWLDNAGGTHYFPYVCLDGYAEAVADGTLPPVPGTMTKEEAAQAAEDAVEGEPDDRSCDCQEWGWGRELGSTQY